MLHLVEVLAELMLTHARQPKRALYRRSRESPKRYGLEGGGGGSGGGPISHVQCRFEPRPLKVGEIKPRYTEHAKLNLPKTR